MRARSSQSDEIEKMEDHWYWVTGILSSCILLKKSPGNEIDVKTR